jgi:hypothetical protein
MNRHSLKWHLIESPVTRDFTLHSRARDHNTRFWKCLLMAFGHSSFWGLSSHNVMVTALWLVCEVVLRELHMAPRNGTSSSWVRAYSRSFPFYQFDGT